MTPIQPSPPTKRRKKYPTPSSQLESIPHVVLKQISNEFLSPKDRIAISSCSKRLRIALPLPMTIQIGNKSQTKAIQQRFFVTPWNDEYLDVGNKEKFFHSNFLYSKSKLQYGQEYILWSFDYVSYEPVYLGRHSRQYYRGEFSQERLESVNSPDDLPYECFYIALQRGVPMQTWKIFDRIVDSNPHETMEWGEAVGLQVAGKNTAERNQPDSLPMGMLSCFDNETNHPSYPDWMLLISPKNGTIDAHATTVVEWGEYEKVRIYPHSVLRSLEHGGSHEPKSQSLVVATTPDVSSTGDGFIYAPWKDLGQTHSVGFHTVVEFEYWIDCGIMFFLASNVKFSLAVPILLQDGGSYGKNGQKGTSWAVRPIQAIAAAGSSRWDNIRYYMALAAEQHPNPLHVFLGYDEDNPYWFTECRRSSGEVHLISKGTDELAVRRELDDGTPLSLDRQQSPEMWKFVLTM